ncbi:MAG: hypothetical protein H7X97_00110 [Opitutaceae bacterium]|nr:hypothetical protein [Verrucomicrobiales bacterium]
MNQLPSRKLLLVAESDLNRAQLVEDVVALTAGVRTVADRARSFGSIASSIAVLAVGLAAFQRGKPAAATVKPSWLQTILKGAGLVSTIWLTFRSSSRDHGGKPPRSESGT